MTKGTSLTVDLVALASNPIHAALALASVDSPSTGTVTKASNTAIFTPAASYTGAASFSYTLTDGATSRSSTVSVTVQDGTSSAGRLPQFTYTETGFDELCGFTQSFLDDHHNDTGPDKDPSGHNLYNYRNLSIVQAVGKPTGQKMIKVTALKDDPILKWREGSLFKSHVADIPSPKPDVYLIEVDMYVDRWNGISGKLVSLMLGRGWIGDEFGEENTSTWGRDGVVCNIMNPNSQSIDTESTGNIAESNKINGYCSDKSGYNDSPRAKRYFDGYGDKNTWDGTYKSDGVTKNNFQSEQTKYFGETWSRRGYGTLPEKQWYTLRAYIIPNAIGDESTFQIYAGDINYTSINKKADPFFYGHNECKKYWFCFRGMNGGNPEKLVEKRDNWRAFRNSRLLHGYRN